MKELHIKHKEKPFCDIFAQSADVNSIDHKKTPDALDGERSGVLIFDIISGSVYRCALAHKAESSDNRRLDCFSVADVEEADDFYNKDDDAHDTCDHKRNGEGSGTEQKRADASCSVGEITDDGADAEQGDEESDDGSTDLCENFQHKQFQYLSEMESYVGRSLVQQTDEQTDVSAEIQDHSHDLVVGDVGRCEVSCVIIGIVVQLSGSIGDSAGTITVCVGLTLSEISTGNVACRSVLCGCRGRLRVCALLCG